MTVSRGSKEIGDFSITITFHDQVTLHDQDRRCVGIEERIVSCGVERWLLFWVGQCWLASHRVAHFKGDS